jgi:hypothetical protein
MADLDTEDDRLRDQSASPVSYSGDQLLYEPPATAGVVSFLSSHEREGKWQLPRRFRALAVVGNIELDLREAEIGYGASVIEAVAFMGNIEITIPPDISVECDGDSLLGTFTLKYEGRANPAAASRDRTVRVVGTAYVGAVSVHVKGPDEPMLARIGRNLGFGRR